MKMAQEIVELSTSPLDDSLFQIPDGCTAEPFSDVLNGMIARMQVPKAPARQAP
jgi:hypothetical protein